MESWTKRIKAKYGKSNTRGAINAAIRGEIVGGDDCLDALELVTRLADRLDDRGLAGADLAKEAHRQLMQLREVMVGIVIARYEQQNASEEQLP